MKEKNRLNVLTELFGAFKKSEVEEKFDELTQALDAAKINRKEYLVSNYKAFAEDLIASFIEDLALVTDDTELQTSLANKFLALAMGAFAAEAPEAGEAIEEEPLPEEAVEIMQDEEEVVDEEEEEEEETVAELSRQVTELAKESADMYKAMNEFIPAIIDMAKTVKALTPLVEQVPDIVALKDQMADLEKIANMRPRIASQDESTILKKGNNKKTNDTLEEIASQIKAGTEGVKTELGVRLKS